MRMSLINLVMIIFNDDDDLNDDLDDADSNNDFDDLDDDLNDDHHDPDDDLDDDDVGDRGVQQQPKSISHREKPPTTRPP